MSRDLSRYQDYDDYSNYSFNPYTESDIDLSTQICPLVESVVSGSVQLSVLLLVFILGLAGNLSVLLVIGHPHIRRTRLDRHLLNLAANDTLSTFSLALWAVCEYFEWASGDAACKLLSVQREQSLFTAVLILLCICVRAVRPTNSVQCAAPWLLGTFLALPALLFNELSRQTDQTVFCHHHTGGPGLEMMFFAFSALRCLTGSIVPPVLLLLGSSSSINFTDTEPRNEKAKHLVLAMILAFTVFQSPFFLCDFIQILMTLGFVDVPCAFISNVEKATEITVILYTMHLCVNPLLYIVLWDEYRTCFIQAINRIAGLKTQPWEQPMQQQQQPATPKSELRHEAIV